MFGGLEFLRAGAVFLITPARGPRVPRGGAALLVMDKCRRACLKEPQGSGGAVIMKRLQRAWPPQGSGGAQLLRPAELAKLVGLQKDYLNRLVRRATGLTLGQSRDRELLRAAEAGLRQGHRVAAVVSDLGFSDANYFARWFRKQTGLSPSHCSNR